MGWIAFFRSHKDGLVFRLGGIATATITSTLLIACSSDTRQAVRRDDASLTKKNQSNGVQTLPDKYSIYSENDRHEKFALVPPGAQGCQLSLDNIVEYPDGGVRLSLALNDKALIDKAKCLIDHQLIYPAVSISLSLSVHDRHDDQFTILSYIVDRSNYLAIGQDRYYQNDDLKTAICSLNGLVSRGYKIPDAVVAKYQSLKAQTAC